MGLGSTLKEFGVKLNLVFDKKAAEEAHERITKLGEQMMEIGLHAAEAGAAILEMANLAGEHSRSLEENSEMLGVNVERLQELAYAAKVAANFSQGELVGALESVSTTLDKVRHGDVEAAQGFIRLGVPLSMITDRMVTADQVMLNLSDRFKAIQDPLARVRLATDAFGSSGAKLLPLLTKGSAAIAGMGQEARSLGVILSKETIEKGAEFDRQFSKVWIVLKNVAFTIGNQLIRYIAPLVTEFQKFIVENKKFIALGITAVMKSLGEYLGIVFKTAKFVADRFIFLTNAMGGVAKMAHVIAIGLGLITAAKIISGIGTLVTSFRAFALVLTGISLPMAAITAGVLGLILVIQDLMSDDSIIKEWIKNFSEKFPNATKLLTGIFDSVKEVVLSVADSFQQVYEMVTSAIGAIKDFGAAMFDAFANSPAGKFLETISTISNKITSFGIQKAEQAAGSVGDWLTEKSASHAQARVEANSQATAGGGSTSSQNNSFNSTINVAIPPGTGAAQATGIVSGGVKEGFDQILRQNRIPALGGVSY